MSNPTVDTPTKGPNGAIPPRRATKDMTKAERRALQEKQKAEKADKVAQRGGAPPVVNGTPVPVGKGPGNPGNNAKGGGGGNQGLNTPKPNNANISRPHQPATKTPSAPAPNNAASAAATVSSLPSLQLFLHLAKPPVAQTLSSKGTGGKEGFHPEIVRLAHMYAEFKIVGANARCMAMLEALKEVIRSYQTPANTSLSRHLITHLNKQIDHLVKARPMCTSMGNAVRHLKSMISVIPVDVSDEDAKSHLCECIDHFVRDRIVVADKVIVDHTCSKIKNGDVIMTYARSSVVQSALLEAHSRGIKFSVVVVDSRPMYEGKHLLRILLKAGISCTYVLLNAIGTVLPTIDLLLLGTASLLSNGAMYSRAGTAMVAMMAKGAGVPVVCCCETYKFSDRIVLDSIVQNEIGTSQTLLPPTSHNSLFPFPGTSPSPTTTLPTTSDPFSSPPPLSELSLLYDVSRPEDCTVVISEVGLIPVQSVPVLLKDYKPLVVGR